MFDLTRDQNEEHSLDTLLFPTHRHSPEFWEHLGRAVATFGFLEEVLGKAIFAFTATREYAPDEIEGAYENWLPILERALTDQLGNLAEKYGKTVKENPKAKTENVDEIVDQIREASKIRNVLCHGSWQVPDNSGKSRPFFINTKREIFTDDIDIQYLKQVQSHVAELSCLIIGSVRQMGYQFPGSKGEGRKIL